MNEFQAETILAAAAVAGEAEEKGPAREFVLSNGIRLALKPVPPLLLNLVATRFRPPEVPRVYIKDDDRWEENPNDPEYLQSRLDYLQKQTRAVKDLVLLRGTEILEVPSGLYKPEDQGWIEDLEADAAILGLEVSIPQANKRERYVSWLRLYAMEKSPDVDGLELAVLRLTALTEEEVAEAAESFRGVPERGGDRDGAAAEIAVDGDRVPALAPGVGY